MTQTARVTTTTAGAQALDSGALPPLAAPPAPEPQGPTPRRPRTMGRRAPYSFDIHLTPADIEEDLSYGRD